MKNEFNNYDFITFLMEKSVEEGHDKILGIYHYLELLVQCDKELNALPESQKKFMSFSVKWKISRTYKLYAIMKFLLEHDNTEGLIMTAAFNNTFFDKLDSEQIELLWKFFELNYRVAEGGMTSYVDTKTGKPTGKKPEVDLVGTIAAVAVSSVFLTMDIKLDNSFNSLFNV